MEDKKYTVCADLKRAFGPIFMISIMGSMMCFVVDNWGDLLVCIRNIKAGSIPNSTCVYYFIFNSYSFGGVFSNYFSCLTAALPFSAFYCFESQGGLVAYKLSRCGSKNYAHSKMVVSALSGGLSVSVGTISFILLLSAFIPVITESRLEQAIKLPYYEALVSGNGLKYVLIIIYYLFLSGAMYSCLGMCVSAFIPNPYVAVCSPVIVKFLIVEIGRLAKVPASIRLDLLYNARSVFISETATVIILTVISIVVCFGCGRIFLARIMGNYRV